MQRGLFIAIEGIDGVGKSTALEGLSQKIDAVTLSPFSPEDAETFHFMFRNNASQEDIHAFSLAALKSTSDKAEELLSQGENVIIDRYICSSIAYYSAFTEKFSEELSPQDIDALELIKPDCTFFLYMDDHNKWQERLTTRDELEEHEDDMSHENSEFKTTLMRTFMRFLQEGELESIEVSDLSPEEVVEEMENYLAAIKPSPSIEHIENYNQFYMEK